MPRATTPPIQIHLPPGTATKLVVAVVVFGMATTAAVLGTALYGPKENSERAFRILDRLKKAPEPEKPQPSPQARGRTGSASRAESVRAATVRT
ncbi:hypothetical protein ACIO02_27045 [Streptomyces sp. NPDC087568]|uniref:hypothetical protein n=1 Tax=unclassified Streptomyces TaxID=2593676 RepID=UPI003823EA11